MLLGCTGDGVVVLKNANCVKELIFLRKHFRHFSVAGTLIDSFKSRELRKRMVLSTGVTGIDFVGGSRSEITSPVRMSVITIWEAIICFNWEFNILFLYCINVLAWSRIFV